MLAGEEGAMDSFALRAFAMTGLFLWFAILTEAGAFNPHASA